VSFEVPAGATLLVVGPSGSGKSTLVLALAGLLARDVPGDWTGELTIAGRDPRERSAASGEVGVVFQDPESQLVMDRAEDDVAFGLENRGWPRDGMRARVPEALAAVGLTGLERRRPTTLSGGQQQRLALAGALAPRPAVLVLDEPTANLDPDGTAAFFERLAALRGAGETTIVLVEHRVDRAWPLADHVLAIGADGGPIAFGAPDEILRRHGGRIEAEGIWLPGRARGAAPARPISASAAPFVVARDLEFCYPGGAPVLSGVDLAIEPGERVALMGPNGSGKTTLGRLLVGLLRPTAGQVRLGGDDPARMPAADLARRAGYVFQDPERQFLARTVEDELTLGLRPDERDGAGELMTSLGLALDRFAARSPYLLSGGEQRRLSLACILARRPSLLVLDEPTFGQDRRGYEALLAILRERVAAGTAVVAATHDERFVSDFADRVVEVREGRVTPGGAA